MRRRVNKIAGNLLERDIQQLIDLPRLKLVKLLCRQSENILCVNALAGHLGVTQSAVSQHLRVLRVIGLFKAERRGYYLRYFMNLEALDRYRNMLSDIFRIQEPHDEGLRGNHCNKKEKTIEEGRQHEY